MLSRFFRKQYNDLQAPARAVECDEDGVRVHGIALLERGPGELGPRWRVPISASLEYRLLQAYGLPIVPLGKNRGLQVVADALNQKDIARAQIATLSKFPELPTFAVAGGFRGALAKRLSDAGWHVRIGIPTNIRARARHQTQAGLLLLRVHRPKEAIDITSNLTTSDGELIPICIADGISVSATRE